MFNGDIPKHERRRSCVWLRIQTLSTLRIAGFTTQYGLLCAYHYSARLLLATMGLVASLMLLLSLLLVPLEVQCQQTFPYVSFMGQTLADHSYVDISQVGYGSASVLCHTDLETCCSTTEGWHRGEWFFPSGDRLPFPGGGDIFLSRGAQRVELRRSIGTGPTGIYRCDNYCNCCCQW